MIPQSRCEKPDAQWVVIGIYEDGSGIIAWHRYELQAWYEAKEIRKRSGNARVVPVKATTFDEATYTEINTFLLREG